MSGNKVYLFISDVPREQWDPLKRDLLSKGAVESEVVTGPYDIIATLLDLTESEVDELAGYIRTQYRFPVIVAHTKV